jgi:hypothetical protein
MISFSLSLLGSAALIGCSAQLIREVLRTQRAKALPVAAALLSLLPVGEFLLGRVIHSFTGFLSVPLLLILCWYTISPLSGRNLLGHGTIDRYRWLVLLVACVYFPSAMGVGSQDLHSLGWSPQFVWFPIGLSVLLLWLGEMQLSTILLAALVAWKFELFGSDNGWNYLIDPIAAIACSGGIVVRTLSKLANWVELRIAAKSERQKLIAFPPGHANKSSSTKVA